MEEREFVTKARELAKQWREATSELDPAKDMYTWDCLTSDFEHAAWELVRNFTGE